MIEIEGVTFKYPGLPSPVLSKFSLSVPRGAFVSLIGGNGTGKSTIAKLLNGLVLPLKGRVMVNGQDTRDRAHLWDIRRAVQLVFQNPDNQLVGGTVEEDIAFGLENLGIPWPELGKRVDWALDFTGLRPLRFRSVAELSGGQKQRVALAGVLAMKPLYVVMDEATSMLDEQGKADLLGLVRGMHKELGMTVLQITQDLQETLDSDHVIVLQRGNIVLEGPPSRVFASTEKLEAAGLTPPTIVLLAQELAKAGLPVPQPTLTLSDLAKAICGLS